jgi:hypothetical protein
VSPLTTVAVFTRLRNEFSVGAISDRLEVPFVTTFLLFGIADSLIFSQQVAILLITVVIYQLFWQCVRLDQDMAWIQGGTVSRH